MDLSGMGPWEMRTARASEAISYSTAWVTNLTVAQQASANAVVKVYHAKREKPKYSAIDLSGGTAATHYPIEYLDEIPGGSWSDEYKTSKLMLRHIPSGQSSVSAPVTSGSGRACRCWMDWLHVGCAEHAPAANPQLRIGNISQNSRVRVCHSLAV